MRTTAITTPSYMEDLKPLETDVDCPRFSLVRRVAQAVEASDWDEEILRQEKWLNGICLAIIAFAGLYLVPILFANLLG